ncbi:hypothetical protein [Actinoplanes derwentensis]|uniref:Uncharacterized protein n=1 Tax=Actinoplanes derwentensis TaxID=113562 RepID=A0A1H1YFG7_9ACTN|nr:hypothetical protein [Actinoplanes derwentensis]GID81123.1 hypothetical protein Ade03nite_00470 [Actinoplanes derwentensis]SDT20152.1 hypothetical protein SAMN04489716_2832 [Actinoplanes derwentensis]
MTAAGRRHRADLVVAGVAVVIFLIIAVTVPYRRCSNAVPCDPEPVASFAISLLPAVVVMTFIHRWAAAVTAVLCAIAWPIANHVDDSEMGWRALLPIALAVTAVAVARQRDDRPRRPRAGTLVAGSLLLIGTLAGIAATLQRQQQVTAQEAASTSLTAVARAHLDDSTLTVELPDGTRWNVKVLSASDYPIGTPVELLVDDDGLRQLRSEPYDISFSLLLPLVIGAGAGVALIARAAPHRRLPR